MPNMFQAKYKVIGLRSYPLRRLNGEVVSVHSGIPPDFYQMDAAFHEARRKGHLVRVWALSLASVWDLSNDKQPLHVEEDMQRLHVSEPDKEGSEQESLPGEVSGEVVDMDEAEEIKTDTIGGTPIGELGLSFEIEAALIAGGISTVEDLMGYPDKPESLTSFKGIGKSRAQSIMTSLVSWAIGP